MIRSFRTHAAYWVGGLLTAFLVTIFAGGFTLLSDTTQHKEPSSDAIALIGDIPISGQAVYEFYTQLSQSDSLPDPEDVIDQYYQAFQRARELALLRAYAKNNNITVTRRELAAYLDSTIQELGLKNRSELKSKLDSVSRSYDAYKDRLKTTLVASKAQDALTQVQLSDDQVRDFYTEFQLAHILIPESDDAATVSQRLYDDILSGTLSFNQAAQNFSADTESASRGGSLGWVSYDYLRAPLGQIATELPLDTVSQPIQTEAGWHLIQISDRRPTKVIADADLAAEKERVAQIKGFMNKQAAFARLTGDAELVIIQPFLRAVHALKTNQTELAIDSFLRATDPNSPLPHYFLAKLYREQAPENLNTQIKTEWEKAVLKSDLSPNPLPGIYSGYAEFLSETGDTNGMLAAYDKAAEAGKSDLNTLETLARIYKDLGYTDRYEKMMQQKEALTQDEK